MCAGRGKDTTPLDEWLPQTLDTIVNQLRADLATSFDTIRHRGARVADVTEKRPMTGAGALVGFALRETSEIARATVLLEDTAGDADGRTIIAITLAPGESVRDWFGPGGISIFAGLNVTITGAVDGSLFLGGVE